MNTAVQPNTVRKSMGAPKADNSAQEILSFITDTMQVKPAMVAALLNITEKTLHNWTKVLNSKEGNLRKFERLTRLHDLVLLASKNGFEGRVILNFLNEPIPKEPKEQSLLHYVVDQPDNDLMIIAAEAVLRSFKCE